MLQQLDIQSIILTHNLEKYAGKVSQSETFCSIFPTLSFSDIELSMKIFRHVEHWNVPKMALLKQILRPSRGLWRKRIGA